MFFRKRYKGFSLVEAIVAIVILFTAVVLIGMLFPLSFKGIAKARDKTVAIALAQQKLEECLTNPRANYASGNFSPERPEYKYDVVKLPVSWTKKFKEMKVKVSKLVNGKEVVTAAMAQLIPSAGGHRIYFVQRNNVVTYSPSGWVPLGVSKTINFPEDGICIVSAAYSGWGYGNPLVNLGIAYDGSIRSQVCANTAGERQEVSLSTSCAFKVSKGGHTIDLRYASSGVPFNMLNPHMTIDYIPGSLVEDTDTF